MYLIYLQAPVPDAPYDLTFLDPPYAKKMGERALSAALAGGWIAEDALILWEESADIDAPQDCALLENRKFGGTQISFLRWQKPEIP